MTAQQNARAATDWNGAALESIAKLLNANYSSSISHSSQLRIEKFVFQHFFTESEVLI